IDGRGVFSTRPGCRALEKPSHEDRGDRGDRRGLVCLLNRAALAPKKKGPESAGFEKESTRAREGRQAMQQSKQFVVKRVKATGKDGGKKMFLTVGRAWFNAGGQT